MWRYTFLWNFFSALMLGIVLIFWQIRCFLWADKKFKGSHHPVVDVLPQVADS